MALAVMYDWDPMHVAEPWGWNDRRPEQPGDDKLYDDLERFRGLEEYFRTQERRNSL